MILLLQKTKQKKHFKNSLIPWLPELFLYSRFSPFLIKNTIFVINRQYFSSRACEVELAILHILLDPYAPQNKKIFPKKFAPLAARAVFACQISLFLPLKQVSFDREKDI